MKPTVLLVDLERVDRQGFNLSFTRSQAESLRIGIYIKADAEQA